MFEFSLIVSIIFTTGHYLCLIASYWEKKFEINEIVKKRSKKLSPDEVEQLKQQIFDSMGLKSPKFIRDNLLIKVAGLSFWLVKSAVFWLSQYFHEVRERRLHLKKEKEREDELMMENDKELKKKVKTKVINQIPDFKDLYGNEADEPLVDNLQNEKEKETKVVNNVSNVWSEEEVYLLIKLAKKYPIGVHERWEKIARTLSKDAHDVIKKAKLLKSISKSSSTTNNIEVVERVKNDTNTIDERWTQEQQKSLEDAIKKYPKGSENRWDEIALMVDGKSKVSCNLIHTMIDQNLILLFSHFSKIV